MAILKCKMCGGDIELSADKTFGTCEFCGSTMTFPKVDDEQRANRFNRGNQFRRAGEFDKALAVYERIVQEDENDAEAHWCCALCRFGIEYVEDPNTLEYLPTCHRASFDSFLEDVDYLAAVEHSDGVTRRQYQKDAQKIAEVQRGILATSQNEEPFDVFICYKESENDGSRTRDSLYAQDIYYQLTEQGRRVFFSRITLEDKAGTEYEPYIFAALNSAKVMILVTTSAEHANAVWVKNEWSRFLSLMRKDRTKLLLPCYRDMDPYDLPEALSVLQSYDMGRIGFIQDLIRGVNKVLDAAKPKAAKETVIVQQAAAAGVAPLLKRAFLFIEDGNWDSANEYCEKVLDQDPENARAYLGKLMTDLKVKKREQLKDQPQPFNANSNYQKALRFADEKLKQELTGAVAFIKDRNETARKEGVYRQASAAMKKNSEQGYREAAKLFGAIRGYKDAAELADTCAEKTEAAVYEKALRLMERYQFAEAKGLFDSIPAYKDAKTQSEACTQKAEADRKDALYAQAKILAEKDTKSDLAAAVQRYASIPGWKDADERAAACRKRIDEIVAQEEAARLEAERRAEEARQAAEARKRRNKRIAVILAAAAAVGIGAFFLWIKVIQPNRQYNNALALYSAGKYEEAIAAFEAMDGYKDSAAQIEACETALLDKRYDDARALYDAEEYTKAIAAFKALDGYRDSAAQIEACEAGIREQSYAAAQYLYDAGQYAEAKAAFEALDGYRDSAARIEACEEGVREQSYAAAQSLYDAGQYAEARAAFEALDGYKDSAARIEACEEGVREQSYTAAQSLYDAGQYTEAMQAFEDLNGYKDSKEKAALCEAALKDGDYQNAVALYVKGQYDQAVSAFNALGGYKDAAHYKQLAYIKKVESLFLKISVTQALAEARKVDLNELTDEERSAFLKSLYDHAKQQEKQGDYVNAFNLYRLSQQSDYEKRMQECNKKYMESPRELSRGTAGGKAPNFKINRVTALYQSGKVKLTVYYTASKKGTWYIWTYFGSGAGGSHYGNFAKGDSSFSVSLNVSEELNYNWAERGATPELGQTWYVYLTGDNKAWEGNWSVGNFDEWMIGSRKFFDDIRTDLYGKQQ